MLYFPVWIFSLLCELSNYFALSLYKNVPLQHSSMESRVAQWKRAGPITQRSEDQNLALLTCFLCMCVFYIVVLMDDISFSSGAEIKLLLDRIFTLLIE